MTSTGAAISAWWELIHEAEPGRIVGRGDVVALLRGRRHTPELVQVAIERAVHYRVLEETPELRLIFASAEADVFWTNALTTERGEPRLGVDVAERAWRDWVGLRAASAPVAERAFADRMRKRRGEA